MSLLPNLFANNKSSLNGGTKKKNQTAYSEVSKQKYKSMLVQVTLKQVQIVILWNAYVVLKRSSKYLSLG